ncbi:MAG: hypothetical protein ACTSQ8_21025 [Candidatus Helarchaeota archaeon]
MTAYLQMGHNTENLVGEEDLEEFEGIILSPVNREPDKLSEDIPIFRERGDFDIILDPQLYYPRGERENLTLQPYFPAVFDTADFSAPEGWNGVIDNLVAFSAELGIDAVISPVLMPRRFSVDFYDTCTEVSHNLYNRIPSDIDTFTTCLVSLSELENGDHVKQIASILTRHDTDGFYIVVHTDIEPRREISDSDGLLNLMLLISLLGRSAPVTVAYSSSDMILFKAAGATNCCTSKFFNLRRFTMSRFEEPPGGGGGQLPYWFSHNLLAFLREADIRRLQSNNYGHLVGGSHSGSSSGVAVLNHLDDNPDEPWLGKSWRQYLSWFGKTEQDVTDDGLPLVREWLLTSERNWQDIEDEDILMDEPRNDGRWLRPWRQALRDFSRI